MANTLRAGCRCERSRCHVPGQRDRDRSAHNPGARWSPLRRSLDHGLDQLLARCQRCYIYRRRRASEWHRCGTRRSSPTSTGCSTPAETSCTGRPVVTPAESPAGGALRPRIGLHAPPAAVLRPAALPGNPVRPARLRAQQAPRQRPRNRHGPQHHRRPHQRHGTAVSTSRHRTMAAVRKLMGLHAHPRPSPTAAAISSPSTRGSWKIPTRTCGRTPTSQTAGPRPHLHMSKHKRDALGQSAH
jgi:hypothetical protein